MRLERFETTVSAAVEEVTVMAAVTVMVPASTVSSLSSLTLPTAAAKLLLYAS